MHDAQSFSFSLLSRHRTIGSPFPFLASSATTPRCTREYVMRSEVAVRQRLSRPGVMSYRGKSLGSCTWRLPRRVAASSHFVASGINFKPMNEFFRGFANQLQTARFGRRRVVQRRKIDEEDRKRERGMRRALIISIRECMDPPTRGPLSRAVNRIVPPAFGDFGAARRFGSAAVRYSRPAESRVTFVQSARSPIVHACPSRETATSGSLCKRESRSARPTVDAIPVASVTITRFRSAARTAVRASLRASTRNGAPLWVS